MRLIYECAKKRIQFHKQMAIELENSMNIQEEKLCYLKYFVNKNYELSEDDIYNIKRINTKEKYFFIENQQII